MSGKGFWLKNGKYVYIFIFLLFLFLGFIIKIFFEEIWNWFGVIDTASAVALAILAFLGYVEYARGEDEVELVFDVEGKREPTGLTILRKNFTRSEIGGILGFIQKDQGKKYNLRFLKTKKFLNDIHAIQKGKDKEFIIPMSKQEREQFEF
jgi:energy-coupling factor transporter transmembrane protein EcfT